MAIDPHLSAKIYRLPNDAHRVPRDEVGLYRFSLRFPTDYELGISAQPLDQVLVIQQIHAILTSFYRAYTSTPLVGSLESPDVAHHLRFKYSLSAEFLDYLPQLLDAHLALKQANAERLKKLTFALRATLDRVVHVYVGLTARQSFRARLQQHLDGQTGVQEGLHRLGLLWANLWFECIPLAGLEEQEIAGLEQLIQSILKPAFCKA